MRWAAVFLLFAVEAAHAQERWFAPRLWLRAFSHDASAVVVEPQFGFWPDGVWLSVTLDGEVAELPPPRGCLWTAMVEAPGDMRRAAAAFCPAPACRDARTILEIDGATIWESRSSHLSNLVWRADGGAVAGVLSRYGDARAQGLGNLGRPEGCLRTPVGVVEFGSGEVVSRLPASLPSSTAGLRLVGNDGSRWLVEIGYARDGGFISHPRIAAVLEAYCAVNSTPGFGRPCGAAVGGVLARLDGDTAEAVLLGGGPVTARTLFGPRATFILSETCEVERLSRRRIRSHCDLLRWDPPFNSSTRLTNGGAVLGGLALSGDGRMIAALNPFAGAESSLILFDAKTGAARPYPIGEWIRVAFAESGRSAAQGDEE